MIRSILEPLRRRARPQRPQATWPTTWPSPPQASQRAFPAGPLYSDLTGGYESAGWVRFKVLAADWYIATLEDLTRGDSGWDRHMGVEMALDGVLSALSGAFDAAIGVLIEAVEGELPPTSKRIPPHQYSWGRLKTAHLTGAVLPMLADINDLSLEIDAALAGEATKTALGWLAVLRRLRNRPTHSGTLPRVWDIDDLNRPSIPSLTFAGDSDPIEYLKESSDRVSDLTERILAAAGHPGWIGPSSALPRRRWKPV